MFADNKKSGFTLIELLIVIAIIGVLAGLVIAVINPTRQRQRAQDGVLIRTINNLAASVAAFEAAKGRVPDVTSATCGSAATCEIFGEVQNASWVAGGSDNYRVWLSINGVTSGYSNNQIIYVDSTHAFGPCVAARSSENISQYYVWKLGDSRGIQSCTITSGTNYDFGACGIYGGATSPSSGTCTNVVN
jgi:prepilin-type N-terminal cleavage/methylation domain-containing protein